MSTNAENLIAAFEQLPFEEQLCVATECAKWVAKSEPRALIASNTLENLKRHHTLEARLGKSVVSSMEGEEAPEVLPAEEWIKRFRAFSNAQTLRNPNVDTSRKSIYEGCGE